MKEMQLYDEEETEVWKKSRTFLNYIQVDKRRKETGEKTKQQKS